MNKLICIVGRTCAGKDTLVRYICKQFPELFSPLISYTTRPKRYMETEGVEHYFVSDTEFDILKNSGTPIAYTEIADYRYMALYEDLVDSNVYIIDPNGLNDLRKNNPNINIFVIYVKCAENVRKSRFLSRFSSITESSLKDWKDRNMSEDEMFEKFEECGDYDLSIDTTSSGDMKIHSFYTIKLNSKL